MIRTFVLTTAAVTTVLLLSPVALADAADDCFAAKDPNDAITLCSRVLKSPVARDVDELMEHPNWIPPVVRGGALQMRSFSYYRIGDMARAMEDIDEAITTVPNVALYYYIRAKYQAEQGNCADAVIDSTKAIELQNTARSAYKLRGSCYEKLGLSDRAAADFKKAAE